MKRGILASILAATMILTAASAGANAAAESAAASSSSSSVSSAISTESEAPEITLTASDTTEVITRLADLQIHKTSDLSDALRAASALPDPTTLDYTGATIVISAAEDIPEVKDDAGNILLPAASYGTIVQSIVLTKGDNPAAVPTQALAAGYHYNVRMTVPPQQQDIALVVPDYAFTAGETDVVRTEKEEIPPESTESEPVESSSASESSAFETVSSAPESSQDTSSIQSASIPDLFASPDAAEDLSYWDAQVLSAPAAEATGGTVQQSLNTTAAFSYGWNAQSADEHPADLADSENEELSLYTTNVVLGQDENGRAKITPANTKVASLQVNADGTLSATDENTTDSLSAGSYYIGLSDTTQYSSSGDNDSEGLVLGAKQKNGRTVVMASNMASTTSSSTSSEGQSTGAVQLETTIEGKQDGDMAGQKFTVVGILIGGGKYNDTVTTDEHGKVLMNKLPVGTYTVTPVADDTNMDYIVPDKKIFSVRKGMLVNVKFEFKLAPGLSAPMETTSSQPASSSAPAASSNPASQPDDVTTPSIPKTGQAIVIPIAATAVFLGAFAGIVVLHKKKPEEKFNNSAKKNTEEDTKKD